MQYYTGSGTSAHIWDKATNTTLYARWTANSYTVEYWNKAGTTKLSSDTGFKYDTARNLAAKPATGVNAGYTAVGWAASANQSAKAYDFGSSQKNLAASGTKKLYLAETANTITLTWNSQGGSAVGNTSKVYASGAKVPMPASNPTRAGYSFKGWFTATSGGAQVTSSTALPTSNATYYAQWNANTITLTWNSQGGSAVTNTSKAYASGAKVPMPASSPTRVGYTFAGWFTATSGGTQVTSNTALPTSNATYYAHWTANTITLTWNSQGGSAVSNTSATYSPTAKVPMPASNPTKAGYTFAGWWTSATGGTQVSASTALPTSNKTYYAHWSLNPYAITYDLAGGSVSGNPTTYNTETTTFTLKNPTRTGYAFAGWSGTGLSGSDNKTVTIAKGSTGNRAYTANWTKNAVHRITLDAQGGQGGTAGFYQWTGKGFYASGSPTDATEPMASIAAPSRAGYAYAGYWSAANGGGTQRIANTSLAALPNTTFAGPATLYAKWEKVESLRVDLKAPDATSPGTTSVYYWSGCGYTLSASSTDVIAPGGSLALTLPRRQGYIFSGYYDAVSGGTQMIDAKGALTSHAPALSSAAAWHAQWEPAVSADVPIEVEARVDVLGIEEQEEASGYIESRCGEPLKVARVDLTPLDGAKELFGASNVADVFLEVLANDGTSPNARFSLGALATESDASKLQAFTMASYGTRVPISYRFAMPPEVQTSLVEHADPTPVCSVVYTVALQNPPT